MRKFLKVLILSLGLFSVSTLKTLPYSAEEMIPKAYYTEPEEIITLAKSLNINIKELNKIKEIPIISPLSPNKIKRISSEFGMRKHPIFRTEFFHEGIDYSANKGEPVRSTANGVVIYTNNRGNYGNQVLIEHENNYSTRYAHLSKIYVNTGDIVNVGDTIGLVGSTGLSTGPHLHYEIRINNIPINPLDMYPYHINETNYMSYFDIVNKTIAYSYDV